MNAVEFKKAAKALVKGLKPKSVKVDLEPFKFAHVVVSFGRGKEVDGYSLSGNVDRALSMLRQSLSENGMEVSCE